MDQLTNNSKHYFHKAEQAFLAQNLNKMSKNLQKVNREKLPSIDQQTFIEYETIRMLHESIMEIKEKFQQSELKDRQFELKSKESNIDVAPFFSGDPSSIQRPQKKTTNPLPDSAFSSIGPHQYREPMKKTETDMAKQPNPDQDTSYALLFSRLSASSIPKNDPPPIEVSHSVPKSSFSTDGSHQNREHMKKGVQQPNTDQDTSYTFLFSRLSASSSISATDSHQLETHHSKFDKKPKEIIRKNTLSYTFEAFIEAFRTEEYQKVANMLKCIETDQLFNKLEVQKKLYFLRAIYISYLFVELHNIQQFLIK